jgi:hypothetical protein
MLMQPRATVVSSMGRRKITAGDNPRSLEPLGAFAAVLKHSSGDVSGGVLVTSPLAGLFVSIVDNCPPLSPYRRATIFPELKII